MLRNNARKPTLAALPRRSAARRWGQLVPPACHAEAGRRWKLLVTAEVRRRRVPLALALPLRLPLHLPPQEQFSTQRGFASQPREANELASLVLFCSAKRGGKGVRFYPG